jgi:hypothetical protein
MGDLRTILGSLLVSAVLAPFGAAAPGQFPAQEDPVRFFATCAGRLSAEMEFQWMFDGARADTIQSERASVLDILDAIMPPDQGRRVLSWRVEAKMAQAALLTRATFGSDIRIQRRAQTLAARNVEACRALLLG